MSTETLLESEDFLSDSLQTLYDYQPITLTTSGASFTYILNCPLAHVHERECAQPISIHLKTPDTEAANWALHASSIWASSVYLSDHVNNINLELHVESKPPGKPLRVLELGASAGLPSIVLTKLYPDILVTTTDYPDEALIKTLSENVERNNVARRCKALPFAWGTDPAPILVEGDKFDVIIAADTIWNSDLHSVFIDALKSTLGKGTSSRIHLVVGLHTGRYTIQAFMDRALKAGFDIHNLEERQVSEPSVRSWEVYRDSEDEKDRRQWVVWIQLKWNDKEVELHEKIEHVSTV